MSDYLFEWTMDMYCGRVPLVATYYFQGNLDSISLEIDNTGNFVTWLCQKLTLMGRLFVCNKQNSGFKCDFNEF